MSIVSDCKVSSNAFASSTSLTEAIFSSKTERNSLARAPTFGFSSLAKFLMFLRTSVIGPFFPNCCTRI